MNAVAAGRSERGQQPPAASHFGGTTPFEEAAVREWGLIPIDARALLVIWKYNGSTCTKLGDELWGRGTMSARPAGLVMRRLRLHGLVKRDGGDRHRIFYRATEKVEALMKRLRRVRTKRCA
jgi:hypothetical protein